MPHSLMLAPNGDLCWPPFRASYLLGLNSYATQVRNDMVLKTLASVNACSALQRLQCARV